LRLDAALLLCSREGWRRREDFLRRSVDWGDEAVTSAGESFHKAGIFGGVAESVPKPFDCSVEAVVEVYESVRRPEASMQFLASDELAGALQEEGQNVKGLVLESHLGAVPAEFAGAQVSFEDSELDNGVWFGLWHGLPPNQCHSLGNTDEIRRCFRSSVRHLGAHPFDVKELNSSSRDGADVTSPALRYPTARRMFGLTEEVRPCRERFGKDGSCLG
jgi:hypothetical protein